MHCRRVGTRSWTISAERNCCCSAYVRVCNATISCAVRCMQYLGQKQLPSEIKPNVSNADDKMCCRSSHADIVATVVERVCLPAVKFDPRATPNTTGTGRDSSRDGSKTPQLCVGHRHHREGKPTTCHENISNHARTRFSLMASLKRESWRDHECRG